MFVRFCKGIMLAFVWFLIGVSGLQAREVGRPDLAHLPHSLDHHLPAGCAPVHNIGKIELQVSNFGRLGFGWNCLTGNRSSTGCRYPKGSEVKYLQGGSYWIGGVVGRDTLVSTGSEMAPDAAPFGTLRTRSISGPDGSDPEAVSEQDFIGIFMDTLTAGAVADYFAFRPHIPLGVEVTQKSYAWSYDYAEDFVLFDIVIRNISDNVLHDVFFGLQITPSVGVNDGYGLDNLCGFLSHVASSFGCDFVDTVNIAWGADNDGEPVRGEWVDPPRWNHGTLEASARHVTGATFLHTPGDAARPTFNWWTYKADPTFDFAPRRRSNFRNFRTGGIGMPHGDVNRYHVLSNRELDYDQAFTANISHLDTTWLYPDQERAVDVTKGAYCKYLLSEGAFTLYPGQSIPWSFAYVAGENFHNDVNNLDNLQPSSYDPVAYYANLDFSDLAKNSMWARWIYDNPGVDTDSDGYFGESRICVYDSTLTDTGWIVTAADTQWYKGDGIPDWRGAAPPPAPYLWLSSLVGGVHVRFNGERSETEKDIFLHIPDFEGYRIYFGRDDRATSLALIASYDHENYDKYVWNDTRRDAFGQPDHGWDSYDIPYTLDSLRCLYGRGMDPCNDSMFHPLAFPPNDPYKHADSLFYFVGHDYNMYEAGGGSSIAKRFPNQRDPRTVLPDDLTDDDYTEDRYLKYFEYEFTIENLLPTVSYWVNVTAFDFGSPKSNLAALETSKTVGVQEAYPFNTEAEAAGTTDKIYIYPNPYRIDGDYRARGFEGRNELIRPNYRVRAIHFTNLPPKCTIRIHSLDGDLVRELRHDMDPSLPTSRDHEWDLVTRNTQMIATGLYYWTVELPDGSIQMGKLVILM